MYKRALLLVGELFYLVSRAMSARHMDPLKAQPDRTMQVFQHYHSNTMEQYILHAVGMLALATLGQCQAVLILVPWFVIGRLVFLLGYLIDHRLRGFGFTLTSIPTVVTFVYCIYRFSRDGLTAGL